MTEEATIHQIVQVGPEGTPGTRQAADIKLQSISISPGIEVDVETFRATGYKWPALAVPNKESTSARIESQPTYDEIIYLLSSLLDTATIATLSATAPSMLWTFAPDSQAADTPVSYTVENGESGAGNARYFTYGVVAELDFDVSREDVSASGTMFGQRTEVSATLTATTTTLDLIPIVGNQFDVYLDDSAASLGGTQLARNFRAGLRIGDRWNQVWPINSSETSFAAIVEGIPRGQFTLRVAADAVGIALISTMRSGDSKFCRLEATGATIESGQTYRLTIDLSLKVTDISPFEDDDGIYAFDLTFDIMHDSTWAKALQVEVVNKTQSL